MSDYIPDDVHSLISLSSSTIGSARADDIESITDSQDNFLQDVDTNYEVSKIKLFQDISGGNLRRDSIPIEPTKDAFDRENPDEDQRVKDTQTGENPFLKSMKYLEQHAILRLFQNLATDIVYNRPDQPLQYIVEKLQTEQNKPTDDSQEKENEQKSEELPE